MVKADLVNPDTGITPSHHSRAAVDRKEVRVNYLLHDRSMP